jgi:tRNA(Ile)-lysidine synthase
VKPRANLEDAARNARYRLMGEWCLARGVPTILLAHTRDDQAETFLLRLGRGSGLDGLSAMRGRSGFPLAGYDGIEAVRPLLGIGRDELRAYLKERDIGWLEDPMNEDPRFARVRIRRDVIPVLEGAGIATGRIAEAARHLNRAREALESQTRAFLEAHVRFADGGAAFLDGNALRSQPREIGLRVLSAVLMRVSGRTYRPRFERLEHLYDAVMESGPARTLSGCRVGAAGEGKRVFGAGTVEVRRERARGKAGVQDRVERKAARSDTFVAVREGNLPKKRRNITRLSGS